MNKKTQEGKSRRFFTIIGIVMLFILAGVSFYFGYASYLENKSGGLYFVLSFFSLLGYGYGISKL